MTLCDTKIIVHPYIRIKYLMSDTAGIGQTPCYLEHYFVDRYFFICVFIDSLRYVSDCNKEVAYLLNMVSVQFIHPSYILKT